MRDVVPARGGGRRPWRGPIGAHPRDHGDQGVRSRRDASAFRSEQSRAERRREAGDQQRVQRTRADTAGARADTAGARADTAGARADTAVVTDERTTLAADGHGCADREGRETRQGPWGHGLGYDLQGVARDSRWDGSDDTPESSGRQRDLVAVGSCMGSLQGQREGRRVRRLSRQRDEGHYESSRLHPRQPRMRNDPCGLRDGEGQAQAIAPRLRRRQLPRVRAPT